MSRSVDIGAKADKEEATETTTSSSSMVDEFAFLASHTLHEPLRKISGFSAALEKICPRDREAQHLFKTIASASTRLQVMVDRIIEFTKIGNEELTMVCLDECLSGAISNLQTQIEDKNAKITLDQLPRLPGTRKHFRILFHELIENSLKFSRADVSPTIKIKHLQTEVASEITLEDNGIGIAQKDLNKAFTMFGKLNGHDKNYGVGLGLPICKRIIEAFGAQMEVTSERGSSTRIRLIFPKNSL